MIKINGEKYWSLSWQKSNGNIVFLVHLEIDNNLIYLSKKLFYTYVVLYYGDGGGYAYYKTEKVLMCISENLKIKCFNGKNKQVYQLSRLNEALYKWKKYVWQSLNIQTIQYY